MNDMQTSAWDKVSEALKVNAAKLLPGQERKIRAIIGETLWEPLQHKNRKLFGKHVRADLSYYGLVFVRLAGTIAVYKKSCV
ncbi:hypothetical protein [Pseudomonas sp. BF-R-01]|uniref:hypothetical protein n=1 Tax=Pseudomonas sp. BF-R-01 TaxID=2832365 RepID=UPI001CC0FD79|nr:hypothetical protein [Pseudomonas sp. BF-R-01]